MKSHHFEGGRHAETDRQVDSTYQQRLLSWDDAMKAACAWLELRPFNAEEVKGLEVNDVQAAAAIHQYLRESSVDDDGIDDKRVNAGSDHPVGMVVAVEGDGGA